MLVLCLLLLVLHLLLLVPCLLLLLVEFGVVVGNFGPPYPIDTGELWSGGVCRHSLDDSTVVQGIRPYSRCPVHENSGLWLQRLAMVIFSVFAALKSGHKRPGTAFK